MRREEKPAIVVWRSYHAMYRHEKDVHIKEVDSLSPRLVVVYTPYSSSVVAHQIFCFTLRARLSRGRIGVCLSAS
jgi:hypothetical protein